MRRWKALAAGAALTVAAMGAVAGAGPGSATDAPVQHCVVRVTGTAPDGHLLTTQPACSSDQAAAVREAGVTAEDQPLGIHWDGPGYTGSNFMVVGTVCAAGWLNLNPSWINRVSSTENFCHAIRHFDGYNLGGSSQDTLYPGGNLSLLNNKTNSIQYLP